MRLLTVTVRIAWVDCEVTRVSSDEIGSVEFDDDRLLTNWL